MQSTAAADTTAHHSATNAQSDLSTNSGTDQYPDIRSNSVPHCVSHTASMHGWNTRMRPHIDYVYNRSLPRTRSWCGCFSLRVCLSANARIHSSLDIHVVRDGRANLSTHRSANNQTPYRSSDTGAHLHANQRSSCCSHDRAVFTSHRGPDLPSM